MQSEAVFLALLSQGYLPWLLILVAGVGNVMGSCVNFWLGQHIENYRHQAWFPVSDSHLAKAKVYYNKFGFWSLLASWLPIIGDPITLLAGVLGERFWRFLLMVSVSKFGRYLAIYWMFRQII